MTVMMRNNNPDTYVITSTPDMHNHHERSTRKGNTSESRPITDAVQRSDGVSSLLALSFPMNVCLLIAVTKNAHRAKTPARIKPIAHTRSEPCWRVYESDYPV